MRCVQVLLKSILLMMTLNLSNMALAQSLCSDLFAPALHKGISIGVGLGAPLSSKELAELHGLERRNLLRNLMENIAKGEIVKQAPFQFSMVQELGGRICTGICAPLSFANGLGAMWKSLPEEYQKANPYSHKEMVIRAIDFINGDGTHQRNGWEGVRTEDLVSFVDYAKSEGTLPLAMKTSTIDSFYQFIKNGIAENEFALFAYHFPFDRATLTPGESHMVLALSVRMVGENNGRILVLDPNQTNLSEISFKVKIDELTDRPYIEMYALGDRVFFNDATLISNQHWDIQETHLQRLHEIYSK